MKKVIFKYELFGEAVVKTDPNAKLLKIGDQRGKIVLWVLVDPDRDSWDDLEFNFEVVGTGWEFKLKDDLKYCDTVQINGLVWHIFGNMPYV